MHGNGFPPIALTAKDGVAESVLNSSFPQSSGFYFLDGAVNGIFYVQSVEEVRINQLAFLGVVRGDLEVAPANNFDHRKVKVACKGIISTVMRRNSHNRAGAIAH